MIKLEHVVLASPEQMEFIIEGMRNPMNSWEKKDSREGCEQGLCWKTCKFSPHWCGSTPRYIVGENDYSLMQRLASAGTDHRKFMRMMPVYVRITAPLYWWKEFDTYKVGTVANSCSTMHKIQEKEFTLEDFSCEHLISDWIGDNNDAIWYKDPPKNGSIECPIIFSPLDALRMVWTHCGSKLYGISVIGFLYLEVETHYGIIVNTRTGMINFLKLQKI